ncbi:deleted in malignant brain tumors 1 protein-like isoform X2 [Mya arenaria]|uniref:deleted in malignant brain tumors 1 protein-like isoform X2 n=1 Tax=Mya arenaria TaxID=6604 RepID=UPI0022E5A0A3|nr:deleted in malignant brain tumors 1 protein-like isoform X2 [Mya arenaria]
MIGIFFIPCTNCQGRRVIRLRNGTTHLEGRVELFHNGIWGTICDDGLGTDFAKVVCRQLGFPTDNVEVRTSAFFGAGSDPIWLDDVTCQGDEASIDACTFRPWGQHNCGHHEDVGVTCAHAIRLRDGTTPLEGRVEVFHNGTWGTICDDGLDGLVIVTTFAKVVCRQLGYATYIVQVRASAFFGPGSGPIWLDDVTCRGDEPSVDACTFRPWGQHNCGHGEDVGVTCTSAIRLRNGTTHEGRVEVFHNGAWGTVCDDGINTNFAKVVCRQLGYPTDNAEVRTSAFFGAGSGYPIWMDDVTCQGHEPSIDACTFSAWGQHDCGHHEDVGVICNDCGSVPAVPHSTYTAPTNKLLGARVTYSCNSGYTSSGAVSISCSTSGWTTPPVCHWDCGTVPAVPHSTYTVPTNTFLGAYVRYSCNSGYTSSGAEIISCSTSGWTTPPVCRLGIRLRNGTMHEGRVEVFHNGAWGTVCDDGINTNFAKVVCRQLGYPTDNAEVRTSAFFGAGSDPIWLDEVTCQGDEPSIDACTFRPWGQHNCGHNKDVGVICNDCGSVPAVPHSTYTAPTNKLLGARVTYSCNSGYTSSGTVSILCSTSGWTTPPVCHWDCGTVPAVSYSTYTAPTNTLLGARVTYSCNSGYTALGAVIISCSTSGWTSPPVCHKDCGTVPVVPHSTYTAPTNTFLGARVTFSCNSGYTSSGAMTIYCQTSGWTTPPVCHWDCGTVPAVPHSTYTAPINTLLGAHVTYSCNSGYTSSGAVIISCSTSGWTTPPVCHWDCGTVPAVSYSTYTTPTNTLLGARVTYSCNSGYTASGAVIISCSTSGWTSPPVCHKDCGTVPAVPHSTYTAPTNTFLGAHVTFSCNSGYTSSGAMTIYCRTSGWTTPPVCHWDCGTVPAVPHSKYTAPINTLLGAHVTYSCNSGYTSSGAVIISCSTSGWTTPPVCHWDCGTVPAVSYSTYTAPTNTLLGARVTYSCNSGYTASGAVIISCSTSGWTSPPVCHKDCGTVPAVPHSTYTAPTNTFLGARVTFSCNSGYTSTGAETISCSTSGWTTPPVCHWDCGTVPAVPHSTYIAPTNTLLGVRVTYSCNSGYTSSDAVIISCSTSGWTTPPVCHWDCGNVPVVQHSTYTAPTNTLLGARVTYSCNSGYTASGAEIILCSTSGWTTPPYCHPVTCSVPDVEDASKDSGATIVYNTTVTYTCAESYIVTNGSLVRTCQADGQLDGTSPTCTPGTRAIRLTNGTTQLEGRVEVVHNGTWGTICDDGTNTNFAKVVCRQLGYATDSVALRTNAYFGAGSDPIWLEDVTCQGDEPSIDACSFSVWGQHNCGHNEDVGVLLTVWHYARLLISVQVVARFGWTMSLVKETRLRSTRVRSVHGDSRTAGIAKMSELIVM